MAPEVVPQVPLWAYIGVCGTMGGATGAVLGGILGSVAPRVVPQVPISGVYWGLWHHGWCHRCRFRGYIGVCGTGGGAPGTITADAIGKGVLSEIFKHIHDI